MSEPTCETCGATVGFCDTDRYPSGQRVCVGAFKRALTASQAENVRLRGALEGIRDFAVVDYGGKSGLRKCESCLKVQTGHGPFAHELRHDEETVAAHPGLLPACIRAIRALTGKDGTR